MFTSRKSKVPSTVSQFHHQTSFMVQYIVLSFNLQIIAKFHDDTTIKIAFNSVSYILFQSYRHIFISVLRMGFSMWIKVHINKDGSNDNFFKIKNHLYCVFQTEQNRQREPNVVSSALSAEFCRHWVAELNAAIFVSTLERINLNKYTSLNKYLISSSVNRTYNQLRLHAHFVSIRHDWAQNLL